MSAIYRKLYPPPPRFVLCFFFKHMAANWKDDDELKLDLEDYVKRNFKKIAILDFVKEKFTQYAWSYRTLGRRLSYFGIKYINDDVDVGKLETAVRQEMAGPGKLLGYRSLHKKIQETHNLNVPRSLVYAMMQEVDPEGLQSRGEVGRPKCPK